MIVLGRITAPFGVKGWVRIHPFGDDPLSWRRMPEWWLSPRDDAPDAAWVAHPLKACKLQGDSLVAWFEGVDDRSAAEALHGHYIGAPREALPPTEHDEYYWADLIGLEVRNQADESLGRVAGLLSTGAHDVLRIKDGETERLIPFVGAYVGEVDPAAGLIRVDWQKDW